MQAEGLAELAKLIDGTRVIPSMLIPSSVNVTGSYSPSGQRTWDTVPDNEADHNAVLWQQLRKRQEVQRGFITGPDTRQTAHSRTRETAPEAQSALAGHTLRYTSLPEPEHQPQIAIVNPF